MKINSTTRTGKYIRICLFVQCMGSNRKSGTLTLIRKRLKHKVILVKVTKHTITSTTRQCCNSRTLQYLTHMNGKPFVEALFHCQRCKHRRIIRATSQNNLRTIFKSLNKRLLAHLCHNANRVINISLCKLGSRMNRSYITFAYIILYKILFKFRLNNSQFKRQLTLVGNLTNYIQSQANVRPSATTPRCTHNNRNSGLNSCRYHNFQISFH